MPVEFTHKSPVQINYATNTVVMVYPDKSEAAFITQTNKSSMNKVIKHWEIYPDGDMGNKMKAVGGSMWILLAPARPFYSIEDLIEAQKRYVVEYHKRIKKEYSVHPDRDEVKVSYYLFV